jgi:hypothetical protein
MTRLLLLLRRTKAHNPLPTDTLLLLSFTLIVPSLGVLLKYTGPFGLAVYIVVVVVALFAGFTTLMPWLVSLLSERTAIWLAGATLLALLGVFAVVYPIANSGVVGGGTDRDEALNIAVGELLQGRYPYYPKTYLNAPISPLPGSLLLATPFVLLGNSAYQNMFWIAAFYGMVARYFRDQRRSLLMIWTLLALSPLFWQEFVTGGDLLANSLFICIFVVLMIQAHRRNDAQTWHKVAAAVLLGIGLASRPNYLLLVIPIYVWLWRSEGRRAALISTALICCTTALLTLPFYLYDPAGFSPLHVIGKVDRFGAYLPFAGPLIVALSGLTALVLALRLVPGDVSSLLLACALPQAVPVVIGLAFFAAAGRLDYTFPSYGFSFLWFGLLASWPQMTRTNVLGARPDA